ncbi:MAG: hypothetical protein HY692_03405 [Cyanobacteria bacterium NC_groundwater_1444_Ag_S-0.65um_54_12]|nr:hypothetical protein [Cyanobacteria bacterium NC_groundwater_1444_Ag_S-0.65um_54_12]
MSLLFGLVSILASAILLVAVYSVARSDLGISPLAALSGSALFKVADWQVLLPAGALWLAGIGTLIWAHQRAWHVTRDDAAHPAIALTVRGYVMLHLGEAAMLRHDLLTGALLLLLLFEIALARRPLRTQI